MARDKANPPTHVGLPDAPTALVSSVVDDEPDYHAGDTTAPMTLTTAGELRVADHTLQESLDGLSVSVDRLRRVLEFVHGVEVDE
jgi:hypothetical protein